ncbi:MAG: putative porin, partial [Deltaproteobacteria bacterium]|nr:putative porin [Deltaproteobacteria bacterium]
MCKNAFWWLWLLTGVFVFWGPSQVGAVTQEPLMKRLDQLSITIQKQQEEIERLKQELKEQKKSVDTLKGDQQEHIQKAVQAETQKAEASWREWVPEWVRKIRISGALRLRYERIWDRHMLNEDGSYAKQEARDRGRIRARLFFDADITDEIATHFMICTNMDSHQEAT